MPAPSPPPLPAGRSTRVSCFHSWALSIFRSLFLPFLSNSPLQSTHPSRGRPCLMLLPNGMDALHQTRCWPLHHCGHSLLPALCGVWATRTYVCFPGGCTQVSARCPAPTPTLVKCQALGAMRARGPLLGRGKVGLQNARTLCSVHGPRLLPKPRPPDLGASGWSELWAYPPSPALNPES